MANTRFNRVHWPLSHIHVLRGTCPSMCIGSEQSVRSTVGGRTLELIQTEEAPYSIHTAASGAVSRSVQNRQLSRVCSFPVRHQRSDRWAVSRCSVARAGAKGTQTLGHTGMHGHRVDFQMFYVLKGWCTMDYEDQGEMT